MLRKSLYPKVESLLNRIAESLNNKGISPNQLTLAGLVLSFLTGCIYATGNFMLAGLVLIVASMADLLDGPLARSSDRVTKFGAFLDSTMDRYADFFLFGGLALYFAKHNEGGWFLITMGIILGSFVTSYSKARAENLIKSCHVGIFERVERIVILALGSLIPPIFPIALWVLLIGTNVTALQRIIHTQQTLCRRKQSDM